MARPRVPPVIRNEILRAYDRGDKTIDTARDLGVSKGYPSKLAKHEGRALRRPRKQNDRSGNGRDGSG